MQQINSFVNSVYRNINGSKQEINELKEEMKSHLIEAVYELQSEGKTEEQAINIAIKRFGERDELQEALSKVFQTQKTFAKWLLSLGVIILVIGSVLFGLIWAYSENISHENSYISTEIREIIDDKDSITDELQVQIEEILTQVPHITEVNIYNMRDSDTNIDYWDVVENSEAIYHYQKSLSLPKWLLADYLTAGNGDDYWCVTYKYLSLNDFTLIVLFVSLAIYATLFTIWAVINAYHHKRLTISWVILFALFNVVGYYIYCLFGKMKLGKKKI